MPKPLICLASLLLAPILPAATIYSETFTFASGAAANTHVIGDVGWAGLIGDSTGVMGVSTSTQQGILAGSYNGSNGTVTGYIYAQDQTDDGIGPDVFLYSAGTIFPDVTPASYEGLVATWKHSGDVGAGYFFSVEVGGSWFSSTTNGQPADGIDLFTSSWNPVTISDELTRDTGTSVDYNTLFGGGAAISNIGYFVSSLDSGTGNQTFRIDNIKLDSVPEPTTTCLIALGALLAMRRRR